MANTATGILTTTNNLYSAKDRVPRSDDESTILGQYWKFVLDPASYGGNETPACMAEWIDSVFTAHRAHRLDPKYHLFKREARRPAKQGTIRYTLGDVLIARREAVVPFDSPDKEFLTLTLTQEGQLRPREAGLGNNPPACMVCISSPTAGGIELVLGDLIISRH